MLPLWCGIASKEQAKRVVENYLEIENNYYYIIIIKNYK